MVLDDKDEEKKLEDELSKELSKIQDLKIKRGAGDEDGTIFISGIDGVTSGEEVLQAICQETSVERIKVRIGEMKVAFGGSQRASCTIPKDKAEALIVREGIRIGLNWCQIRERVEVVRCFRCWGYGHYGKDCKADKDSSKLCRKCGGKEHMAKECKGEERCLTCKEEGHVTGSRRCPEFRKAVTRERALNIQRLHAAKHQSLTM